MWSLYFITTLFKHCDELCCNTKVRSNNSQYFLLPLATLFIFRFQSKISLNKEMKSNNDSFSLIFSFFINSCGHSCSSSPVKLSSLSKYHLDLELPYVCFYYIYLYYIAQTRTICYEEMTSLTISEPNRSFPNIQTPGENKRN